MFFQRSFKKSLVNVYFFVIFLRLSNSLDETSLLSPKTGVSNSRVSGGHIAYMSNRAEGRTKFWIWRSPLLWAMISVMLPEIRSISKKKKVITFPPSVNLSPNDKNLCLSSVACDLGFKRLFNNDPLQYFRNSLVIPESSRGPH